MVPELDLTPGPAYYRTGIAPTGRWVRLNSYKMLIFFLPLVQRSPCIYFSDLSIGVTTTRSGEERGTGPYQSYPLCLSTHERGWDDRWV